MPRRPHKDGPVIITDRGRPAHVLLTIEEDQKLTEGLVSIVDMLAMPVGEDIALAPPRLRDHYPSAYGRALMYVLDTDIVSELRRAKAGKADKNM